MRTLILLRHGKAVPHGAAPDFERPLTEKGKRDSMAAGILLKEAGIVPDVALVSPAQRTRMTWNEAQRGLPPIHETLLPGLYQANSDDLLEIIHQMDDSVGNVCVVGHNPALQEIAARLAKSSKVRKDIGNHFPPGSLIVLRFECEGMSGVSLESGKVVLFHRPESERA
jgi:phosphohistidine phosphatase